MGKSNTRRPPDTQRMFTCSQSGGDDSLIYRDRCSRSKTIQAIDWTCWPGLGRLGSKRFICQSNDMVTPKWSYLSLEPNVIRFSGEYRNVHSLTPAVPWNYFDELYMELGTGSVCVRKYSVCPFWWRLEATFSLQSLAFIIKSSGHQLTETWIQ